MLKDVLTNKGSSYKVVWKELQEATQLLLLLSSSFCYSYEQENIIANLGVSSLNMSRRVSFKRN